MLHSKFKYIITLPSIKPSGRGVYEKDVSANSVIYLKSKF